MCTEIIRGGISIKTLNEIMRKDNIYFQVMENMDLNRVEWISKTL